MRVLFVAHSFPRFVGDAAGSFLLRLARGLVDRGIEVEALVPHARGLAGDERIGGIVVHRFRYAPTGLETLAYTGTMAEQVRAGLRGKGALVGLVAAGAAAAIERTRRFGADVIHAHWWFPGGLAGTAASLATGVPLVTTSHGSDVRLVRTIPGGTRLLRVVAARSAGLTAVSTWLGEELRRAAPNARPLVAPMPVDSSSFAPADAPARGRLLFVGRLNEQKGLASLLRALACARITVPLDVVGDGPLEPTLRELAAELGVASRLTWYRARTVGELAELYRHAAALVVPSCNEGLGLVAVEAQLSATPVIAFASGGLTDVINDGDTGLLVAPGDTVALANAITRVVGSPELGERLGRAARIAALERFTPESAAERYASIYQDVIAARAA